MMGLQPDLIPLGLDGGPDANTKDQQVEDDGGQQSRDIQTHVETSAAALTEPVSIASRGQSQEEKDRLVDLKQKKWREGYRTVQDELRCTVCTYVEKNLKPCRENNERPFHSELQCYTIFPGIIEIILIMYVT